MPDTTTDQSIGNEEQSTSLSSSDDELMLLGRLKNMWSAAEKKRLRWEQQWYLNDNYVRGNHYIVYNTVSQSIITLPKRAGQVRRVINIVRKIKRGIKNLLTANDPRWEVSPTCGGDPEKNAENAKRAGQFLTEFYKDNDLKGIIMDIVDYAYTRSVGFLEIVWDGEMNEGIGGISMRVYDPFDIYIDPSANKFEDARFIIKAIKTSTAEIKSNPQYEVKENLSPDEKEAASVIKNQLVEQMEVNTGATKDKDIDTVILYEMWIKDSENDDNIRVISWANDNILRNESTNLKKFPFIPYYMERDPGAIYAHAWVTDLIYLNKIIDNVVSSIEEYCHLHCKGKMLQPKTAKVRPINDQNGQILEWSGVGAEPKHMDLKPLPSTVFNLIERVSGYLEDMGGVHDQSMGKEGFSGESGKHAEAIQSGDMRNLQEPVDNLKLFLQEIARRAFDLISDHLMAAQEIYHLDGEDADTFKIIGAKAPAKNKDDVVIDKFDKINVDIVSGLGYSPQGQKETALLLHEREAISTEDLLEFYKWGNVQQVLDRLRKQKSLEEEEDNSPEGLEAKFAELENQKLAQGQQVTANPEDNHQVHMGVHSAYLKAQESQQDQDLLQRITTHFKEHEALLNQGKVPAIRGAEQAMEEEVPF